MSSRTPFGVLLMTILIISCTEFINIVQGSSKSCIQHGITVCCTPDHCPAQISPDDCYCDTQCSQHGDCCDDIDQVCPKEKCTDEDIRLVGGSNDMEGRVEVCLNEEWGTICHHNWNNDDAKVVCEQLGHPNTGAAGLRNARFTSGNGPIHLSDVNCKGNESSIWDCPYDNATLQCNHGMDASVRCGRAVCTDGQVRLANGLYGSQGRVEVCLDGVWGSVCDNGWDRSDALVVCRQLNMSLGRVLSVGRAYFGSAKEAINMNDVQCNGRESKLTDCKYNENSDCSHSEDAGVFCGVRLGCIDGTLRLVNGSNSSEGRVEMCRGSSWVTICDQGWDNYAASVVCRQLGYPSAGAVAFGGAQFGPGDSRYTVLYTNVTCTGHETTLRGCKMVNQSSVCPHTRDVGVRCLKGPGQCTDGSVRLMDGIDDYEGRVEVCLFERWGTVCDHSWSTAHAEVICRQLGLPTYGAIAYSGAYHGIGMGPINIDDAKCTGNEANITQCKFTSNDNCLHLNDAGVKCACNSGDIRLAGGRNQYEGRVEICVNGVWGTVTDDGWDSRESDVVCRQLGFFGNITFPKLFAAFGQGKGSIHITNTQCRGSESSLLDCSYSSDTTRDSHAEDAGVICTDGSLISDDAVCTDGDVKLVNFFGVRTQTSGQVVICAGGVWTTPCVLLWDSFDSGAFCSNLGYPAVGNSRLIGYTLTSYTVSMSLVSCTVGQKSIFDCFYTEFSSFICQGRPFLKVGATCYQSNNCTHGSVRLSKGPGPHAGLVEVCYYGVWGTITSTSWSQNDAKVICKQLGYFPHLAIPRFYNYFGGGVSSQPVAMNNVRCAGNEDNITQCVHGPVPLGWGHTRDAGVECFTNTGNITSPNCTIGSLRLVEGNTSLEGRVEVCLNGIWGTICDDFFNANSANVICRQLGFTGYGSIALPLAHYGQGTGPIFIDNLRCTGHEGKWWECSSYSSIHNCQKSEDASVRCKAKECTDGKVRLVGGSSDMEGRIEVCVNGVWGTVCDDYWTGVDAKVICRQLGYSDTFALGYNSAFFGPGTGLPILMDNLHCIGNETLITDCPHETHTADCSHNEDAGVKCYPMEGSGAVNNTVCSTGDIRLVNGSTYNQGRVEVCIDNVWGTVCDDRFYPIDARIACRQLGFSHLGATAVPGAAYGVGTGPIFMDNTYCFGEEEKLLECLFDPHTADCTHLRDVGVICSPKNQCAPGDIRLINGSRPTEGRLELCLDSVWGTVTSIGFDNNDAKVACGQLGYDRNYAITFGYNTAAYFGEGTGPVHMHNVACVGNETSLFNCTYDSLPSNIINPHVADAGVRCFNTTAAPCVPGSLRLVNGSSSNEGRLEMCLDGVWGTLCGVIWLEIDALVVCRQLGYNDYTALTLPMGSYGLGNSSNSSTVPIYVTPLCNGREERLLDCAHYHLSLCNHSYDTAVRCFKTVSCAEGSLRLINAKTSSRDEGRVEICQHGVWGTICDDFISRTDARVICRTLGMSERFAVSYVGGYFGSGTGPIHIDDIACTGTEKRLIDCKYDSSTDDCTHAQDAGVGCYNQSQCVSGNVRLVGGNGSFEGRLDFCVNNIWGSVCGSDFGITDATVICNQLGLSSTYAVPYYSAYYGRGYSEIVADHMACFGSESKLEDCRYDTIVTNCNHGDDVGVACYMEAQCNSEGQVRLVGGTTQYEGRVEICLNGLWGTVEDDYFGKTDAAVVCRTLGYPTIGAEVFYRSYFGRGNGRVHMNNVGCTGSENNLTECTYTNILSRSHHNEDVGVRCYSLGNCTSGSVRLADGQTDKEGRLEVCVNNTWGTVSVINWSITNSRLVCGELGYSDKLAYFTSSLFGAGQGPIFFTRVQCTGNEGTIFNCSYSTETSYLPHFWDVGLICFNKSLPGDCTNGDIRLAGSSKSNEGRVEICAEGIWKMICDNSWDQYDTNVVCRHLGFADHGSIPRYASFFGHTNNGFLIGNVLCGGYQKNFNDCYNLYNPTCSVLRAAGVTCLTKNCTHGDVRLVGGKSDIEGRVEVCLGGIWGTVCHTSWSTLDARVVCRQLGQAHTTAVAVPDAYFGLGKVPILMTRVGCRGNETALVNCTYSIYTAGCIHGNDAGVKCYKESNGNCTLGELRLMGGARSNEGRVEVCINGVWGTVCDTTWNYLTTNVACGQLGYQKNISTPFSSSYFSPALPTVPVHINRVSCSGDEDQLVHCSYRDNVIGCGHASNDAGVRCYESDNCTHGSLRLTSKISFNYTADGRIGRLEMCYRGVWSTISTSYWTGSFPLRTSCRQLGLESLATPQNVDNVDFGPNYRPRIIVSCRRLESRLSNCYNAPSNVMGKVVAIYCPPSPCKDGDVRLVNGTVPYRGRVELCVDNTWGTVSHDYWSYNDGKVVCGQLGYSNIALRVRYYAYYGQGKGPIHLTNLRCAGDETDLLECYNSKNTQGLVHAEDAGVDCNPKGSCTHGDVRLVNGTTSYEGRLEACIDGVWGTVTSDYWTYYESRVVCGQLGYSRRYALHVDSTVFGQGNSLPIVLDNVFCGTSDQYLVNCSISYIISYWDTHAKDIGVLCYPENAANCTTGEARLIDGSSDHEGTVQICIGGVWGTVCDNWWNKPEGQVICRQLGYSEVGLTVYGSSYFGNTTTGPIYLNYMSCSGSEANLLQCYHSPYTRSCTHGQDAGVICHPGNNCTHGEVRLAGSSLSYEGRVEVCFDGVWGTVCHDGWNQKDAQVVCKQLGLPNNFTVPFRESYFGSTNIPIILNRLLCYGNETNLTECISSTFTASCTHDHDVGVACLAQSMCSHGEVRFVNGTNGTTYGTLEVCYNGVWGTVCDDGWGTVDAKVACKAMGLPFKYAKPYHSAYHGSGKGPIFLSLLNCRGNENNLTACKHIQEVECTHGRDAGVLCLNEAECTTEGEIRLVNGSRPSEGRLEVCLNGVWGTVTDDYWDSFTAGVVCTILGYSTRVILRTNAYYGQGVGPIHLDNVFCLSGEKSILECRHSLNTAGDTHAEDVGLECLLATNCTNGEIRLYGGTTSAEGRVEVCVNGHWGTVYDYGWNSKSANVVCRQLGYNGEYSLAYYNAYHGPGNGTIALGYLSCSGNEKNLLECTHTKFPFVFGGHSNDAGVKCFNDTDTDACTTGDVRLVGGASNNTGIAEICIDGQWGTLCGNYLLSSTANVICGQLGFASKGSLAIRASNANFTTNVTQPILLSSILCTSNQDNILDCSYNPDIRRSFCSHRMDIGVVCTAGECVHGQVRLINGSVPWEGRVEICEGSKWGTVCDDFWDYRDAQVICRQLGYSGDYASPHHYNAFAGANVPIAADSFNCIGNESKWSDCSYSTFYTYICTHSEDAGVLCYNNTVTSGCTNGDVRLINGTGDYEGRVEVCIFGVWSTVCDDSWDSRDAKVVCNQLGYNDTGVAFPYEKSYFGGGSGNILLSSIRCDGGESDLLKCLHSATVRRCDHTTDASVRCIPGNDCNVTGAVRLVNGSSPMEGRLEVCSYGKWHTVPDSQWSNTNSRVVCNQLGYSKYFAQSYSPTPGSGLIYMSRFSCEYEDNKLFDCYNSQTSFYYNNHVFDVGVRCFNDEPKTCTPGDIRLVNGSSSREGRPEACLDGEEWVNFDSYTLGAVDARVICAQLGFGGLGAEVLDEGTYGEVLSNKSIVTYYCSGSEVSYYACSYYLYTGYAYAEDSAIKCELPVDNCTNGDLRLRDGPSTLEGRVEICYGRMWGTINDDYAVTAEANVICRQLGFAGQGNTIITDGTYDIEDSSIPVAYTYIICSGNEPSISNCTTSNYGFYFVRSKAIGVRCKEKESSSSTIISSMVTTTVPTLPPPLTSSISTSISTSSISTLILPPPLTSSISTSISTSSSSSCRVETTPSFSPRPLPTSRKIPTVTSVSMSSTITLSVVSSSSSNNNIIQPSNSPIIRLNSLKATVNGNSSNFNSRGFKEAVASSINSYCESSQCRKRQSDRVTSDDVVIQSITDMSGGQVSVEFYVKGKESNNGVVPVDVLEKAVQAGIDDGTFTKSGFNITSLQRSEPTITSSPGVASKSAKLSGAASVGLALGIIILVILISSIIIIITLIWLKRRTISYSEKDILLDDSSGFLSNRSSCVDIEIPSPSSENNPLSEKEMLKFQEAMQESSPDDNTPTETTDQV